MDEPQEKVPKIVCPCDDGSNAIAKCEDCDDYLCILCYHAHIRVKLTKDHNITTFEAIIPPSQNGTF